ncbi:hypothetical protein EG68_02795 [Paragonimus skrjabini miyazakii]|uniref:Uncharacterized protein n=1 Tax=Paragonimus skrjabini miyazakii TaxID=59628 RepID=A0A8S9Z367_9TREM|nr:hypothetical protein EG68_02795 [Paragonimus skrjabini miyazakii]
MNIRFTRGDEKTLEQTRTAYKAADWKRLLHLYSICSICITVCEQHAQSETGALPYAIDECRAIRLAAHLSPTFRRLMQCPDMTDADSSHQGQENSTIAFGTRSFYPSRRIILNDTVAEQMN